MSIIEEEDIPIEDVYDDEEEDIEEEDEGVLEDD